MTVKQDSLDAERLLMELSELTGESLTEAATRAISERLARLKAEAVSQRERKLGSLFDLIDEARAESAALDARPLKRIRDELWGDV